MNSVVRGRQDLTGNYLHRTGFGGIKSVNKNGPEIKRCKTVCWKQTTATAPGGSLLYFVTFRKITHSSQHIGESFFRFLIGFKKGRHFERCLMCRCSLTCKSIKFPISKIRNFLPTMVYVTTCDDIVCLTTQVARWKLKSFYSVAFDCVDKLERWILPNSHPTRSGWLKAKEGLLQKNPKQYAKNCQDTVWSVDRMPRLC